MGMRMTEYLQPSARIEEYSIGADLVKLPPSRSYTLCGIDDLKRRAHRLLEFGDKDDQICIEKIHRFFKRNDYLAASSDLCDSLEEPLKSNVIEWISSAPPSDIEKFCLWSLERTLDLSRSLLKNKRHFVDHTLAKTNDLIDNGLFPPIAKKAIEAATSRYYLQGVDSFHSGGVHRIAFCDDHRIGISNLYNNRFAMTDISKEMQRTMFHEYVHGGGNDRGFFQGLTHKIYLRIIEEAFVEHATVVAHSHVIKQPRTIHPKKRMFSLQESSGAYLPERTFLAVTCEQTDIAVEQLSEAYFSPRGDERGERLRSEIEYKIGKFFGSKRNFYAFVDLYEDTDSTYREDLVHNTLYRLQMNRKT